MSAFLSDLGRSFFGDIDPAGDNGYSDPPPRKGFFTDTSVCIGCKACEVACKEWNLIPEDGIELSGMLRQHPGAGGVDVATRRLHRAGGARAGGGRVRRAGAERTRRSGHAGADPAR